MDGKLIKDILAGMLQIICFNPDPYYQQAGPIGPASAVWATP